MLTKESNYSNIMNEVRIRLLGINTILENTNNLPEWLPSEIGYLQLRMICELIALACLTAHGNIAQTKKLQNDYAADKIIKSLERLHPDFFPLLLPVHLNQAIYM